MVKPSGGGGETAEDGVSRISPNEQSCKYKGVRKRKWGKWVSEIRLPNSRERIWLGSYDSAEKAARAFDAALFCLRGNSANFNFPEAPPEIAGGRFLSCSEIQVAASRFANSYSSPANLEALSDGRPTAESSCGSSVVSDGMTLPDGTYHHSSIIEEPNFHLLATENSANFPLDFEIFPGFDELNSGFVSIPSSDHELYGTMHYYGDDGLIDETYEHASLWNF